MNSRNTTHDEGVSGPGLGVIGGFALLSFTYLVTQYGFDTVMATARYYVVESVLWTRESAIVALSGGVYPMPPSPLGPIGAVFITLTAINFAMVLIPGLLISVLYLIAAPIIE